MTAKTTFSFLFRILIALGVYTLFDAGSLAEQWKQKGAPARLADMLTSLGEASGLSAAHARISEIKAAYQDIDLTAFLQPAPQASTGGPAQTEIKEQPPAPAEAEILSTPVNAQPEKRLADDGEPVAEVPPVPHDAQDQPDIKGEPAPADGEPAPHDAKPASQNVTLGAEPAPAPEQQEKPQPKTDNAPPDAAHDGDPHDSQPNDSPQAESKDDPAAEALRELAAQHDETTEPQAENSAINAGTQESDKDLTKQEVNEKPIKDNAQPAFNELLYAPAYAARESAEQEHQRRTSGKPMFEKPLKEHYTVLLAGDSFMEEMTLAVGRHAYYRKSGLTFHSIARFSTGLTSTKNWYWQTKLEEGIEKYRPDIVLILMGANDLTGIVEEEKTYVYLTESWKQRYQERAEALIDTALSHHVLPIWIGLPVMTHEPFLTGIPLISGMQEQACKNRNTIYVDTLKTLADEHGNFQFYKKDKNGKQLRLRKKDKCHIAADGMLLVLDEVVPYIRLYAETREHRENDKHSKAAEEK